MSGAARGVGFEGCRADCCCAGSEPGGIIQELGRGGVGADISSGGGGYVLLRLSGGAGLLDFRIDLRDFSYRDPKVKLIRSVGVVEEGGSGNWKVSISWAVVSSLSLGRIFVEWADGVRCVDNVP